MRLDRSTRLHALHAVDDDLVAAMQAREHDALAVRFLAERHLADEVTVLTDENDSVTLLVDSNSHLPRTRTFYWRDPVYKDKNQDDETYDNWHLADGLPSAFIVTRYRNADMTRQVYLSKVSYNQGLPDAMFDADLEAAKLLK